MTNIKSQAEALEEKIAKKSLGREKKRRPRMKISGAGVKRLAKVIAKGKT